MTKQEFLAMSIFSNLKYLDDNNKIVELHCVDNGIGLVNFGWGDAKEFTNVKPILHPLSSLTKEIEHKGDKFVPIERLGLKNTKELYGSILYTIEKECIPVSEFFKLIKMNFDVCSLIEKNEAIDVNTLTENPYK